MRRRGICSLFIETSHSLPRRSTVTSGVTYVFVSSPKRLPGTRIQRRDELRRLGDLFWRDAEFFGDLWISFPSEIVEVVVDDAVLEAVVFAEALQLDEEAVAQIDRPDPDRIETLHDGFSPSSRSWIGIPMSRQRSSRLTWRKPDSPMLPISIEAISRIFGTDLGKAELVGKVVLQRDGLDDGVHHVLVFLVRIIALRRSEARLGHVLAPFLVEL
jgi:hypothetical protein